MNEYLFIGKIVGTHGIKGEVKLRVEYAGIKELLKVNTNLYLSSTYLKKKIIKIIISIIKILMKKIKHYNLAIE